MPLPVQVRKQIRSRRAGLVLAALVIPAAAACTPYEPVANTPGTTPSVWTGSPAPSAEPEASAGQGEPQAQPAAGEKLTAQLKMADGSTVATADFEFSNGYATITVNTTAAGKLSPGFHGLHVHSVGKCEPDSTAPSGGAPGNFLSAGGHLQVPGHTGYPTSGDLPNLYVREDGSGMLVTTTSAFTAEELTSGDGTAIMIHQDPSNFGNIPPQRYQQVNGTPGPDKESLSTGDAGSRVACGVIGTG